MLVHKKSRKLLLNLRDPDRITGIIPSARVLHHKGVNLVAVPHNLDEVRVLRNMGIDAPSPILHYYDWPGVYQPYEHQRVTAEFFTLHQRAYCLNDMGTGKTISLLWAYDYLRKTQSKIGKLLIIGTLSTLERTWGDEIFKNFFDMSFSVLHGSIERRLKLLDAGSDVLIINHDGIKHSRMLAELQKRIKSGEINVVVVDEIATFRNPSTLRWKTLKKLVEAAKWVWGLTGTPIPNAPTDAYGQCKLVTPGTVPPYFGAFRDMVMRQVTDYDWVARDNALETVYSVMQPGIRYSRAQCIDLPPTLYQTREVELSPEQKSLYKQMVNKFKAEYAGGQITAVNEAAKINKLLQIVCGVAYGDNENIVIPAPERVNEVLEIIEQSAAKVIVFVPLTGALEHLAKELSKHHTVAIVHGATSKTQRDVIFRDFQSAANPRVLVAQPGAMSHGLNLTAASTIVWFAPTNSNETWGQANARIVRPGQKHNTLIVSIEGSAMERKMYDRLNKKTTTQGLLLDMFQTES